jgi:hypothetical protein
MKLSELAIFQGALKPKMTKLNVKYKCTCPFSKGETIKSKYKRES